MKINLTKSFVTKSHILKLLLQSWYLWESKVVPGVRICDGKIIQKAMPTKKKISQKEIDIHCLLLLIGGDLSLSVPNHTKVACGLVSFHTLQIFFRQFEDAKALKGLQMHQIL